MLPTELRAILIADGPTAAIVAKRVYLAAAPDDAVRPYVLLTFASGPPLKSSSGTHAFSQRTVEAASVADTYEAACNLAAAVKIALADCNGGSISDITLEQEYDAPNLDASASIFVVVQVYQVTYKG